MFPRVSMDGCADNADTGMGPDVFGDLWMVKNIFETCQGGENVDRVPTRTTAIGTSKCFLGTNVLPSLCSANTELTIEGCMPCPDGTTTIGLLIE